MPKVDGREVLLALAEAWELADASELQGTKAHPTSVSPMTLAARAGRAAAELRALETPGTPDRTDVALVEDDALRADRAPHIGRRCRNQTA